MIKLSSIILAAGEGKRMKSKYSKVLHEISGKPMVEIVLDAVKAVGIEENIIVVGHKAQDIMNCLGEKAKYAHQDKQLGTGHAVMMAQNILSSMDGYTLVLCGDTPLITSETIKICIEHHIKNSYAATVITAKMDNPTGYGRIVRNINGHVSKIVEHKDADENEKMINEVNSGMYCFTTGLLFEALKGIGNNNSQGEYYLTDTLEVLIKKEHKVGAIVVTDNSEIMGVNSKIQLAEAQIIMNNRINKRHLENGVTIIDPNNTHISIDAKIERDSTIYPGTFIEGSCEIGEDCIIGPNSHIINSTVGNNTKIIHSVVTDSKIGDNTNVGPFSYIRPNSFIGNDVKVGDFVEIKNSSIGNETKISHLTYIGDAEVGKNVNFGCGTVVVNYDGIGKHKTTIEDNVFIGCNSNLISPVTLKSGCYIAAGSTITDEVPSNALAIARSKQVNKEEWVTKRNKK